MIFNARPADAFVFELAHANLILPLTFSQTRHVDSLPPRRAR